MPYQVDSASKTSYSLCYLDTFTLLLFLFPIPYLSFCQSICLSVCLCLFLFVSLCVSFSLIWTGLDSITNYKVRNPLLASRNVLRICLLGTRTRNWRGWRRILITKLNGLLLKCVCGSNLWRNSNVSKRKTSLPWNDLDCWSSDLGYFLALWGLAFHMSVAG